MKLKSDWSLSYFLHYFCWLSYWIIAIAFLTQVLTSILINAKGYTRIHEVPVNIYSTSLEAYNDIDSESIKVQIPKTMQTLVSVSADTGQHGRGILVLYAIKTFHAVLLFLTFFILSRVFKNVAMNNPFHPKNSRHLFTIGWIFIVTGIIAVVIGFLPVPLIGTVNTQSSFKIISLNLRGDMYILFGIVTTVFSYIFKEGARIYEEQKLTV